MFSGTKFFGFLFFGGIAVIVAMLLGGAGISATVYGGIGIAVALYFMLFFANRLEQRDIDDKYSKRPPPRPADHHRQRRRPRR